MPGINGIININKEAGYTSFDVVARLRGILKTRKIGHTGTLDPDATGVLPVCVGNATKVCSLLTDKDKEYVCVMRLGVETDTQDMTGNVLQVKDVTASEAVVRAVISDFTGEISQVPPMYSALKVQGQKLCDLARKGIEVERKPRTVKIFSIVIEKTELPLVKMRVKCSKGTYIRTLCHDIGERLGCGAAMESLVRTRVAEFALEEAFTLGEVEQRINKEQDPEKILKRLDGMLLPVDRLFAACPAVRVRGTADRLLRNGNPLDLSVLERDIFADAAAREECLQKGEADQKSPRLVRMYREDGRFAGLYQWKEKKIIPYKMFLE